MRMKESGRPLQCVVGTGFSPKTPPAISTMPASTTAAQSTRSQRPQNRGIIGDADRDEEQRHRQGGRQCSSYG